MHGTRLCMMMLVTNQRLVRLFVFVVFAVVFIPGCASRVTLETREFSVQSRGLESVCYSISSCLPSKVAVASNTGTRQIETIAFLFERSSKYYINLTYSDDILPLFCHSFPDAPPYGFGTLLTADQQAWVLQRCKEKIGDSFSYLDLLRGQTGLGRIREIFGYAEGGNGDVGFVAELDVVLPESSQVSNNIFGERIVGVAFPSSTPTATKFKPVDQIDRKALERIQRFLRSQLEDETCQVIKAIRNRNDGATLAVAEHKCRGCEYDRGTSVFYLRRINSALRVVPFKNIPYSIDTMSEIGFPLDIYPGSRENTLFSFLPDIDRDGRD